jgi:Fe-S-cluster containining protein
VFLTKDDRKTLAAHHGLSLSLFNSRFCDKSGGFWKLKDPNGGDCIFLKNKKCGVYNARPTQCRTWPFWPEVLNAKTWNAEVANFCPGVGKGKLWSPREIERQIAIQVESETKFGK